VEEKTEKNKNTFFFSWVCSKILTPVTWGFKNIHEYLSKCEIVEISISVSKKWRMHHAFTAHKVFELTQTMTRNF
jgi:hypothetical protein